MAPRRINQWDVDTESGKATTYTYNSALPSRSLSLLIESTRADNPVVRHLQATTSNGLLTMVVSDIKGTVLSTTSSALQPGAVDASQAAQYEETAELGTTTGTLGALNGAASLDSLTLTPAGGGNFDLAADLVVKGSLPDRPTNRVPRILNSQSSKITVLGEGRAAIIGRAGGVAPTTRFATNSDDTLRLYFDSDSKPVALQVAGAGSGDRVVEAYLNQEPSVRGYRIRTVQTSPGVLGIRIRSQGETPPESLTAALPNEGQTVSVFSNILDTSLNFTGVGQGKIQASIGTSGTQNLVAVSFYNTAGAGGAATQIPAQSDNDWDPYEVSPTVAMDMNAVGQLKPVAAQGPSTTAKYCSVVA